MASFFPKVTTIKLREGVIEKSVCKVFQNESTSIDEKITIISQKLKSFELSNDKSDDLEYAKWLCYFSDLYYSFQDDKNLTKAIEYASKAQDKCRRMHAENIPCILRQIKCNMVMKNPQEIKGLTNYLYEIVNFHLGNEHPVMIEILEQFGDMHLFFENDQKTMSFYNHACDLAKLHIGGDHIIRLRLLKKLSRVKILVDQPDLLEQAFYHMLEVIEIMKKRNFKGTYEMAVALNDTLRISMDVKFNAIAFEVGYYAQKMYVKILKDNKELLLPLSQRSEALDKMIEKYYENCKWMKKLCFNNHRSYKFFREFCDNQHKIFMDEISTYKQYLLHGKLSGVYENRYNIYQRLIKCYVLLGLMLLEQSEKNSLVHIVDRFNFDILRNLEENEKKDVTRSAICEVMEQVEKDFKKDPFEVWKKNLDFFLKERLNLLGILEKNRFKDIIYFYEPGDLNITINLRNFRGFVTLCGFNDFRNILLNLDS